MSAPAVQVRPRLSPVTRIGLAVLGLLLGTMLLVACWLVPETSGRGTHQQLGLPPCTFVLLFDSRCPSCGMTTAWAHVVRGQFVRAARANSGGMLLALSALVVTPWSLTSAVRGRLTGRLPSEATLAIVAVAIVVTTLVDWLIRLSLE